MIKQKLRLGSIKHKVLRQSDIILTSAQHRGGRWTTAALGDPHNALCYAYERMPFTPERVVQACCQGLFIDETAAGKFRWTSPKTRYVLLREDFHVPKRVRRYSKKFDTTINADYAATLRACANREKTWIGPTVIKVYEELHRMGVAHSVEAWQDGKLAGGGIGLSIGGYFTLESLFYTVDNASKAVVERLGETLFAKGFEMIDCQVPSFVQQFGSAEMSREDFLQRLSRAIVKHVEPLGASGGQDPDQEPTPIH